MLVTKIFVIFVFGICYNYINYSCVYACNISVKKLNNTTLVLIPFDSKNEFLPGNYFNKYLLEKLVVLPNVEIIERADLNLLLKEKLLHFAGIVNNKDKNTNKISEAEYILIGSIITIEPLSNYGGKIGIFSKIININTGKIICSNNLIVKYTSWRYKEIIDICNILYEKGSKKLVKQLKKCLGELSAK